VRIDMHTGAFNRQPGIEFARVIQSATGNG
jgi:hypothetical protein